LSVFALHRKIILAHFEISYPEKFGFALLNALISPRFGKVTIPGNGRNLRR